MDDSLKRQKGKCVLSKDWQHLLPSTLGTWEENLGFEVPPLVTLCTQQQFKKKKFTSLIKHAVYNEDQWTERETTIGILFYFLNFFGVCSSIKHAVYNEDPWTQKDTIIGKFSMSLNMHTATYKVEKMYLKQSKEKGHDHSQWS
jgi:hypothetical protein